MNMISKKNILDIAYELKRAFEEKDLIAIENIYSDDVVVWHNYCLLYTSPSPRDRG